MSRNIHDVDRHGTLMVQVEEVTTTIWNRIAGFDVGLIPEYSGGLSPKHMAELSHIREGMSGYSDEDLESMIRIGAKAQIALELRKSKPNVNPDQVDFVCQPIIKR
ncbi:hypothetical protein D5P86_01495 [Salmonella enterica subsp. enterica serovar Infantis]|nr:hypothetical protein [Salmonella enterica subsp. enterica serovar Infantis]